MIPFDKLPADAVRELVRIVVTSLTAGKSTQPGSTDAAIQKIIDEEIAMQRLSFGKAAAADALSPRLRRVLPLLLQGREIKAIAHQLNLSSYTIQEYVQDIYRHFGVYRRAELQSLFSGFAISQPDTPSSTAKIFQSTKDARTVELQSGK